MVVWWHRGVDWFRNLSPSVADRLIAFTLMVPTTTVLVIARTLTPDPSGMGTHHQLGLGQCTFLTFSGWPCPMCGMTTTFTHMAHLEPLRAVVTQPFGVVLFVVTWLTSILAIIELIHPRGRWRAIFRWMNNHENPIAWGLILGLFLGWAYKIAIS